jgi:O-antigen/teichoic acid export membrane protein
VDKLLVAALVSVAAVTFYVVPVLIAQRLTTLVGTVSVAFLPAATQLHAENDRPRFAELVFRAEKLVALVVLPVAAALIVFAEPILSLWLGPEFAERSAWPLRLLVAGYALSALGTVPAVGCDAVGRPGVATAFSVAGAVFNVGLCLVLIPRYGITGAGAVILCQSLVFLPVFLWFSTRRVLRLGLGRLLTRSLARPVAATALAALLMVALLPLVHGWGMLVLAGLASAAWYALVARVVGAYDAVDTGAARRSLARPPAAVADSP